MSQYKNGVFKLSGHDMVILPTKFVDELRNVPEDELSSIKANTDVSRFDFSLQAPLLTENITQNFQGVYSAISILTESNLHSRVLQTRLTPKLGPLIPIIREELEYSMTQELPEFHGVH